MKVRKGSGGIEVCLDLYETSGQVKVSLQEFSEVHVGSVLQESEANAEEHDDGVNERSEFAPS